MPVFDTHTHSRFSDDGREEPRAMAETALQKGLLGLCITDHFDCDEVPLFSSLEHLRDAKAALEPLQQEYRGRLLLCRGVELAQGTMRPDEARHALAIGGYDYVLGSVHAALFRQDYYMVDWQNPPRPLPVLVQEYFEACLRLAQWDQPDAVAHLGYLRRYATARDGVALDYSPCRDLIEEILRTVIATGKALEVNTSGFRYGLPEWIPDSGILHRYRALGGELVTIGSDAHRCGDIGAGHREAQAMLWELGFRYYAYYQQRKPVFLPLEA